VAVAAKGTVQEMALLEALEGAVAQRLAAGAQAIHRQLLLAKVMVGGLEHLQITALVMVAAVAAHPKLGPQTVLVMAVTEHRRLLQVQQ
jgi:hypothetical protein